MDKGCIKYEGDLSSDSSSVSRESDRVRVVWTASMDSRLLEWIRGQHGEAMPDAKQVNWREAAKMFDNAKPSYLRKRYKGVLMGSRRETLNEEEASRLIECVETMGMVWEEIAKLFSGRTGLYLKNYYYTAYRRYLRRKQGLKYGSKTVCPVIDEYFSKVGEKRIELAYNRELSLTDVVEEAVSKRRRE